MRVVEQKEGKEELFKVPGSRAELKQRLKLLAEEYKRGQISQKEFLFMVEYLDWETPYLKGEEYEETPLEGIAEVMVEHISSREKLERVLKIIEKF